MSKNCMGGLGKCLRGTDVGEEAPQAFLGTLGLELGEIGNSGYNAWYTGRF